MRTPLAALDGRHFDVAVIGAGINGASAAQHLAGAGYSVLLVDKGDFCSGSSSRSSRLLHCGLRYLAPGGSMWNFVLHPSRLRVALSMARQAMLSRRQFVQTTPERTRPLNFHFPLWQDGEYKPWQVDIALRILARLAPGDVPLDVRRLSREQARRTPLVNGLRDMDKLAGVAAFREYQFDWPERICMDEVLDAERLGAFVRNYTPAKRLVREGNGWRIVLGDAADPSAEAKVLASVVLNMAGIWIDRVNRAAGETAKRKITGTKGAHIVVQLPPECAGNGVATINRLHEPFYCVPWRGMHYFGPTETLYEGDLDDVHTTEEEIAYLLDEANHLMPGLGLQRKDVIYTWAGVRPLTYDPSLPKGARSREIHDLSAEGLPNVFAMTAGPIMTHRSAGPAMVKAVKTKLQPRGPEQPVSYAARLFPENQNAPPLLRDDTAVKLSDLRYAAEHEHATNLVDILFRRVGVGWSKTMGAEAARIAAETVAEVFGWDDARVEAEVVAYRNHLARQHTPRGSQAS
ncbi:MAG TPA: FAD-dependent oxidoreductase [Microvirga sp.]|nr:FAD-dependent oxidoreductase [Microvirga sp.]